MPIDVCMYQASCLQNQPGDVGTPFRLQCVHTPLPKHWSTFFLNLSNLVLPQVRGIVSRTWSTCQCLYCLEENAPTFVQNSEEMPSASQPWTLPIHQPLRIVCHHKVRHQLIKNPAMAPNLIHLNDVITCKTCFWGTLPPWLGMCKRRSWPEVKALELDLVGWHRFRPVGVRGRQDLGAVVEGEAQLLPFWEEQLPFDASTLGHFRLGTANHNCNLR